MIAILNLQELPKACWRQGPDCLFVLCCTSLAGPASEPSLGRYSMRRLRPVLIAASLGLVCGIFYFILAGSRNPRFHARSFLKVEVRETHLFPMIYRDEPSAVSNFLSGVGKRPLLSNTNRSSEMSSALEHVRGVRGTSLLDIAYSGPDSNAVQVAASNAANLAIIFYATNQPSWQITLVETRCFTPMSVFQRLEDSLWVYWHRCKASLGL